MTTRKESPGTISARKETMTKGKMIDHIMTIDTKMTKIAGEITECNKEKGKIIKKNKGTIL